MVLDGGRFAGLVLKMSMHVTGLTGAEPPLVVTVSAGAGAKGKMAPEVLACAMGARSVVAQLTDSCGAVDEYETFVGA